MNEKEKSGFVLGCFVGFRMPTSEIAVMLEKYGIDPDRDDLATCKQALRDFVGEDRWKMGIRAIQVQTMIADGLFN